MNNSKTVILWMIVLAVLFAAFSSFNEQMNSDTAVPEYSEFLRQVESGRVRNVTIIEKSAGGREIIYSTADGKDLKVFGPRDDQLINDLVKKNIEFTAREPEKPSLLYTLFINAFPFILLIGVWVYFMRQMQSGGGGRGAMSFGKSRARLQGEDQVRVTFDDVAGVEEAKEEVSELADYLRDPGKYQKLGGKIPRGVLLVGSPGTGKTLLARAIAGEAKVPFFTISGSDFVEMFVGVGASRVRDMFEQAKKQAPCIIFIDEIDAVGRHRGAGLGGGHDEREQTLNQLLVEMDGFEGNEGVIIIAATNRPDVLDPALLRPGRFDRQVVVPLPDIRGREMILKVHMRKVPFSDNVNTRIIARSTPGFSGADLANLVNEAALFAAREDATSVAMEHFERAKDKLMMGSERRSMVMSEEDKKLTAYHEAGHAIVGRLMPNHDPVYKVSIIPRGRALGVTMFLPDEDKYSQSLQQLNSMLSSLYGGRIAEELIFGSDHVTTGASNDIERATSIARSMVERWGLSEELGPMVYSQNEEEVFLGKSMSTHKQIAEDTARKIDTEVRRILDAAYQVASDTLDANREKLHMMSDALMKYETIDSGQIDEIMAGNEPGPPRDWWDDRSSDNKPGDDSGSAVKAESNTGSKPVGGPAEQT